MKIRVTRALTMVAMPKGQNRNNNRPNNRSTGRNNQEDPVELVGRTPNGANKGKFQIIPLGGLGEIGKT